MTANQPSRRRFLVAGGASVLGAAGLAACSGSSVVNTSGTVASTEVPATAPTTKPDADTVKAGQSILRTATSLEHSLVAFYTDFAAAAYVTDADAQQWGQTCRAHHVANATALSQLTRTAGGKAYTKSNSYVDAHLVEPQMKLAKAAKSAPKLIALAASLEEAAASTDTLAVRTLARANLRQGLMEVGAANARHATLWQLFAAQGDFAGVLGDALYSLRNALGAEAAVDAPATS